MRNTETVHSYPDSPPELNPSGPRRRLRGPSTNSSVNKSPLPSSASAAVDESNSFKSKSGRQSRRNSERYSSRKITVEGEISSTPSSSSKSSYSSYNSSSDTESEDFSPETQNQESFNLGVEPIPVLARERRVYRGRRKNKVQEQNINCIRLPYTDVIRSASDLLQEIFTAVSDHDKYFRTRKTDFTGDSHRTPNPERFRRSEFNPEGKCGRRSISLSTAFAAGSTHIDPYTGDWMTDQEKHRATGIAEGNSRTLLNGVHNSFSPEFVDVTRLRFVTIFASADPDSVCAVSLLKVRRICFNIFTLFHFILGEFML